MPPSPSESCKGTWYLAAAVLDREGAGEVTALRSGQPRVFMHSNLARAVFSGRLNKLNCVSAAVTRVCARAGGKLVQGEYSLCLKQGKVLEVVSLL